MSQKILWILAVSTAFIISGCESREEPKTKTEPHQVVKSDKAIKNEEMQPKPSADQIVEAVAEKAEEIAEEVAKVVEKEVIATMEEQTDGSVQTKVQTMTKIIVVGQETTARDEIVIEASYGNVTLPHAMHAEAYECSTCHGQATPAAFELGKEEAHKACKGCHKHEGAGPTSCKGCHKR